MDAVSSLRRRGLIDEGQEALLSAIHSGRLFSFWGELRALLYLGAILIVLGAGATVKRYLDRLGPLAIIGSLSAAVLGCYGYCFSRGRPYSSRSVESPTAVFDYALYLGCAFLGVEFAYIETHYHLLDKFWDYYLLASAAMFFYLAYRFDNRLVLAMALLNLGAWFGIRLSRWHVTTETLRLQAVLYGSLVIASGLWIGRAGVKEHFTDTYLNIGLNVLYIALLSGVKGSLSPYLAALLVVAAASIAYAMRRSSLQYFLYGVAYAYMGISDFVLRGLHGTEEKALYLLLSAAAVTAAVFRFRKSLEQGR